MTWVKVLDGQRINHGPGVQLEGGSVVEMDDREAARLLSRRIVEAVEPPAKKAPAKKATRKTS